MSTQNILFFGRKMLRFEMLFILNCLQPKNNGALSLVFANCSVQIWCPTLDSLTAIWSWDLYSSCVQMTDVSNSVQLLYGAGCSIKTIYFYCVVQQVENLVDSVCIVVYVLLWKCKRTAIAENSYTSYDYLTKILAIASQVFMRVSYQN